MNDSKNIQTRAEACAHVTLQNQRIGEAFDILTHVLNDWQEEHVAAYPLTESFDEIVHALGGVRFALHGAAMRGVEEKYKKGDRIRLKHDLDRYPNFIAKAGSTGTIDEIDLEDGSVWIKMDEPIPGCEEWRHRILWREGDSICSRCEPNPEAQHACNHGRDFLREMTVRESLDYDVEPEPEIDQLRRLAELVLVEGAASDFDPVYALAQAWKRGAKC
jgi:hypothetical protein